MDSAAFPSSSDFIKCAICGCSCSSADGSAGSWIRTVERKYDECEGKKQFTIAGLAELSVAKVEIEDECVALREMVGNQQQAIQDLYTELEEERSASSSAATEAMSMILRLQREKAEIQMETRQFKRFSEEKIIHDQQKLSAFEDLLFKREQVIQSLTCEVRAYKHRMLSYGLTEPEIDCEPAERSHNQSLLELIYDYPPLRCKFHETRGHLEDDNDVEKYASGDTPLGRDHLKSLETRIGHIERSLSSNQLEGDYIATENILDKVVVGQSPRRPRHSRKFSTDSSPFLGMVKETTPVCVMESPRNVFEKDSASQRGDDASEAGDDMSDRVYTIDSVHNGTPYHGYEDYIATPRASMNRADIEDPEIKKLYMRLHALEADRESMRQAIISMRTDKAQLVLLKEITQHLCKEMMATERRVVVKKPSLLQTFSFVAVFKWITCWVFWKKKAGRSKYLAGLSGRAGLPMLVDKGGRHTRQWRCLASTQV